MTSLQDSIPPALFCSEQWLVKMKLPILDVTRPELLEPKLEFCEYPEESSHEAFGPESKDGKARPEKKINKIKDNIRLIDTTKEKSCIL